MLPVHLTTSAAWPKLGDEIDRSLRAGHVCEQQQIEVLLLTGYGSIPTTVDAMRLGAINVLTKPADADDVEKALLAQPDEKPDPPENPMSADRVRWEHIQRVYELCNRNVSETARRLNMHRRTLQRILAKRAPR